MNIIYLNNILTYLNKGSINIIFYLGILRNNIFLRFIKNILLLLFLFFKFKLQKSKSKLSNIFDKLFMVLSNCEINPMVF